MKHLDEYRRSDLCQRLLEEIRQVVSQPRTIMEVCGGQTHGLLAHGIDQQLADTVELIHGPGCPVCVTPAEDIDFAISLCKRSNVLLASFGDMLRVPGSKESLLQARAQGGNVRIVYSPLDAIKLAQQHPEREVVFFAVGFETTTPATAIALHQARQLGLENFSLLVAHVRVQPALEVITEAADCRVQGFLAAGHVCAVTGYHSYQNFVQEYQVPVVVTGFEPVDLLQGILECVRLIEQQDSSVENSYSRGVQKEGNLRALQMIDEVYEICDRPWRGLGTVRRGGFRLREGWKSLDARRRFSYQSLPVQDLSPCRSSEVLTGQIKPSECEFFADVCCPESPLGAPMVSSEGACAAYYRYARWHVKGHDE